MPKSARPTRKQSGKTAASWIRRKNVNIDQAKLDKVREILGAESETEAIDQALSLLLLREELVEGVARIAGTGGVTNYFENDREP